MKIPARGARHGREGFSLNQILLLVVLLALLGAVAFYITRQEGMARQCANNLRLIYIALEMYEIDRGHLPSLAFFPDDPQHDADSLPVALARYGVNESICVCPASHRLHRELGLTYVWNVKLNGTQLHEPGERGWMLVEINALSRQAHRPHLGTYNILYTDGAVERSSVPPSGLSVP